MSPAPIPAAPRRAYSYLRFSTPEQRKGDSKRRQQQMAQDYAARKDLVLDDSLTFHDLGVSGYRGQNVQAGRLGYFLEAVRTGLVPQGSVLLVEQLDRLSRLTPLKAVRILEDICEAGVSVVTLNDEREYSGDAIHTNSIDLLIAILTFMRANEESATKSRRLKQTWEGKRSALSAGKVLTRIAPKWIEADRVGGTITLNEERAAVVRRIFDMTLAGVGQHAIAETFNREGLPRWGSATHWQRSYIAKILASRTTIGELTPHVMDYSTGRKTRTALEPIPGYYPPVISAETFADVQALSVSKRAPGRRSTTGAPLSNILAGMARCPLCEATMTRVQKGSRSKPSLVCVKAKSGAGCDYHSVPYAYVEQAILDRLAPYLESIPSGGPGNDDDDQAVTNASATLDALKEQAASLLDNLAFERSAALVARLRQVEDMIDLESAALTALLERREATSGPLIRNRVARVLSLLSPAPVESGDADAGDLNATVDRAALNAALRGIFARAVINWQRGTIDFDWTHGGTTELPYAMAKAA